MKKLLLICLLISFSCDDDPVASDTTAPTVTITYPVNNATLSAQTNVSVNVVDDSDITSVVFLVNGTEAFTDTEAPFEYSWDVCALTEENATILVNATDSGGNVGVSSLLTYEVDASYDCAQVCGGESLVDECGVCDDNSANNCGQDCGGNWGGTLVDDECGETRFNGLTNANCE